MSLPELRESEIYERPKTCAKYEWTTLILFATIHA
jgi:hypothetical protein